MKQYRALISIAFVGIFLASIAFAAKDDFRNISRLISVGLTFQGHPRIFTISPKSGYIEIFDNSKMKAVYSGKAEKVVVKGIKGKKIKITIDDKKNFYYFRGELIFSPIGRSPNHLKLKGLRRKSYSYRGSILIKPYGTSSLQAINLVDIEDYLKSVVPSEIYSRSPHAALQAQAVAARTYAVRNINRHKKKGFNVCDKVHCQVYRGLVKEVAATSKAVMQTSGKILTYIGSPANTVYHSNCGGVIKNSKSVWGGKEVPYLVAHRDGIKGKKLFCRVGKLFQKRKLPKKMQKPRKKLIVRSLKWNYKHKYHKNFGHRVGMCQDGAIGMGAIGYNFWQILSFYYPGTAITTLNYAKSYKKIATKKPTKLNNLASLKNVNIKLKKLNTSSNKDMNDKTKLPKKRIEYPSLELPNVPLLNNPAQAQLLKDRQLSKEHKNGTIKSAMSKVYKSKNTNSKFSLSSLIRFRKLFWASSQPSCSKFTH